MNGITSWLHYDVKTDTAFMCCECEAEKMFLVSTKREPVFISKGFTYRKEDPKVFKKHQGSGHRRFDCSLSVHKIY